MHSLMFTGNTEVSWFGYTGDIVCVVSSAKRYQKQGEKQNAYEMKAFKKEHLTALGVSNEILYHKAVH